MIASDTDIFLQRFRQFVELIDERATLFFAKQRFITVKLNLLHLKKHINVLIPVAWYPIRIMQTIQEVTPNAFFF